MQVCRFQAAKVVLLLSIDGSLKNLLWPAAYSKQQAVGPMQISSIGLQTVQISCCNVPHHFPNEHRLGLLCHLFCCR